MIKISCMKFSKSNKNMKIKTCTALKWQMLKIELEIMSAASDNRVSAWVAVIIKFPSLTRYAELVLALQVN